MTLDFIKNHRQILLYCTLLAKDAKI